MAYEMDESLLQDFLTESAELIDQLDGDLVRLESADENEQAELCNSCFRALHTIKGAASFLALTAVTEFAHAAEDALNALRKGEAQITASIMDVLLQSADVVRNQVETLSNGGEAPEGPTDLIEVLHRIAAGEETTAGSDESSNDADKQDDADEAPSDRRKLELEASKLDLLEFMAADLQEVAGQIAESVEQLTNDALRTDAAAQLSELAEQMQRTASFFELPELSELVDLLSDVCPKLPELEGQAVELAVIQMQQLQRCLTEQSTAIAECQVLQQDVVSLREQIQDALAGRTPEAVTSPAPPAADAPAPVDTAEPSKTNAAPVADEQQASTTNATTIRSAVEPTIRVEVGRLESLLNLVGQLVLNKNRVLALTRNLADMQLNHETVEDYVAAAGDLDRLTSELQVGVMRTRMQPLGKLFDRYPRVIRDMARMTNKQINLVIRGKETEVDKSVLELLADPLVHILRNSADHGVESPDIRTAAGKDPVGTIRLEAEHQGSHVLVAIIDDGKGLDRKVLGRKAVDKGLCTPEQLAALSDKEVFRFIFEAGFSTAAQVSDLSGRGVGMDVVRTNVNKLNGTINIESTVGTGTRIEILIPLTVAIMPAMVVGIGEHLYSVPLQCIVEIVKPHEHQVHVVSHQPVIRLRDTVMPLLDMHAMLGEPRSPEAAQTPGVPIAADFAVVVQAGGQRISLCVDRLIGQQEIVIKPLDDAYTQAGPFSGATIREDGEVSLILDIATLMRNAQQSRAA